MKATLLVLALLGAATLAAAQAPEARPCPERIRDFDERRAAARQAQDQAAAESQELSRRTEALDAERAATD